jgi:hypothetical protein
MMHEEWSLREFHGLAAEFLSNESFPSSVISSSATDSEFVLVCP